VSTGSATLAALTVGPERRHYQMLLPNRPLGDVRVQLEVPPYEARDRRPLGAVLWQIELGSLAHDPRVGVLGELIAFPQLPLAAGLLTLLSGWRRAAVALGSAGSAAGLIGASTLVPISPLLLASFAWYVLAILIAARVLTWLTARVGGAAALSDASAVRWLAAGFAGVVVLTFLPDNHGDGWGYYAYTRSLVLDADLNMANEYRQLWATDPFPGQVTPTGLVPNPWSIGPGLIWMPPYLLAHALLTLAGGASLWPADGYSDPYVLAATLSTALATLIFLMACYWTARRWCSPKAAALAAFGAFVGSTLWFYSMRLGTFAHGLSAMTTAVFLWCWVRLEERDTARRWAAFGAAAGLMVLIYWACAVLLLGPAISQLRRALPLLRAARWGSLLGLARRVALAAAVAVAVFSPQMAAWKVIYGSPLVKPDATPSATFQSQLLAMLVAPYGLLPWTPFVFVGALGLVLLMRRDGWLTAGLLLSFSAYFFYNSILSDWHGSGGFGLRRLTSLAPWAALGMALIYDRLLRAGRHVAPLAITLGAAFWMLMILIRTSFGHLPDITPLGLDALNPADYYLSRTTVPAWGMLDYMRGSYFGRALSGKVHVPLVLAALLALVLSLVAVLHWGTRGSQKSTRRPPFDSHQPL
jgi:hypothetical protein